MWHIPMTAAGTALPVPAGHQRPGHEATRGPGRLGGQGHDLRRQGNHGDVLHSF